MQLMKQHYQLQAEYILSVQHLSPGIYFAKLQLASGLIENVKFIIQH
jgi:hypothetical protein